MATKIWIGSTSTDPTTAGNWSPSGVPADGDDIVFNGLAQGDLAGSDQSDIEAASIKVYKSCTVNIGSASSPWQIGPAVLEIGLDNETGQNEAGPAVIAIDLTSDACAVTVHDARTQGENGFACVLLRGTSASNTLDVRGGSEPDSVASHPASQLSIRMAAIWSRWGRGRSAQPTLAVHSFPIQPGQSVH